MFSTEHNIDVIPSLTAVGSGIWAHATWRLPMSIQIPSSDVTSSNVIQYTTSRPNASRHKYL